MYEPCHKTKLSKSLRYILKLNLTFVTLNLHCRLLLWLKLTLDCCKKFAEKLRTETEGASWAMWLCSTLPVTPLWPDTQLSKESQAADFVGMGKVFLRRSNSDLSDWTEGEVDPTNLYVVVSQLNSWSAAGLKVKGGRRLAIQVNLGQRHNGHNHCRTQLETLTIVKL